MPEKSRKLYEKDYETFTSWCNTKGVCKISENVLLAYFEEESKTKMSSTLWSLYSKLRACINIDKNIDIKDYARLQAFLKRKSVGYKPKKSLVLDLDDINKFINGADNSSYLGLKVSSIYITYLYAFCFVQFHRFYKKKFFTIKLENEHF